MDAETRKICIPPGLSIRKALRVLNDGHQRIVLIVDEAERLLGVLADADIRRAIIAGLSFELPVSAIMATNPVVAASGAADRDILALMKATTCYELPLVDESRRVLGLKKIDAFVARERSTEVVIMAGGTGTRLNPLTETIPKPLIPVGGKPILFILLDLVLAAGLTRITLALNYKADLLRQAVAAVPRYAACVRFVEEDDRLGTAGALSLLSPPPAEPFIVVNADLLTTVDFKALLSFHQAGGNQITMAVRDKEFEIPFGVVELQGTRVLHVKEKPVQNFFVNAGLYVLDASVLPLVPYNRFFDMPDLINAAVAVGMPVGIFPIHEYWLDIGRHSELRQANEDVASVLPETGGPEDAP